MPVLKQALTAVKTFKPLTQEQVMAFLDRTRDAAVDGRFELYKTTATSMVRRQTRSGWASE